MIIDIEAGAGPHWHISKGKESKQAWSEMDVERLMKDAQYADQAGQPRRALDLVSQAFSLLAELQPQISGERSHLWWGRAGHDITLLPGSSLAQIEEEGSLLRSKSYLGLGRLEVLQQSLLCNNNYLKILGGAQ